MRRRLLELIVTLQVKSYVFEDPIKGGEYLKEVLTVLDQRLYM